MTERLGPQGVRNLDDLAARVARANAADYAVIQALDEAVGRLGRVLAAVVAMVNPQVLVLGGTLGQLPSVVAAVDRHIRATALDRVTAGLSVIPSRLGDEAGTAGLTMLVTSQVFSPNAIDTQIDSG